MKGRASGESKHAMDVCYVTLVRLLSKIKRGAVLDYEGYSCTLVIGGLGMETVVDGAVV